ncbi:MAG: hydrogenase iron-sulfur subunit [Thermodesulfobacteriota bacterium]
MSSWDEAGPIVAFHCNWEPYSSLMSLGRTGDSTPFGLKLVRVMCAGRVDPGTVLLCFEKGAQGVMIMSCPQEGCRYGPGPALAREGTKKLHGLMRLLGLGPERLIHLEVGPHEEGRLSAQIRSFCHTLSRMKPLSLGKTGTASGPDQDPEPSLTNYGVMYCLECGKCTGACPAAQMGKELSPRLLVRRLSEEGLQGPGLQAMVWECLTCGLCQERCPVGVRFLDFILTLRRYYWKKGQRGRTTHGGALHHLMRMQGTRGLTQDRLGWLPPGLRVRDHGEVLYFVGCIPYLDLFFSDLGVELREIPVSAVRLLNEVGIEPVILPDERCCGHDLLWAGDHEGFERLRWLNLESFQEARVKTIVTACAECCYVLKTHYTAPGEPSPFEVMHLSELLHRNQFRPRAALNTVGTYQDPCRLGRLQGVFEAPRSLLASVMQLVEMPHSAVGAWCCGNSAWLNCDGYSKQMQVERLLEAKGNGSRVMATACPKCQIHLQCAMRDPNLLHGLEMEVQDLSTLLARAVEASRVRDSGAKG